MKDPLTRAEIGTLKDDGKVYEPGNLPLELWLDVGESVLLARPETDHRDWPFRLFIRWEDLSDALPEHEIEQDCGGHCENIEILCVSIEAAGEDIVKQALQSCFGPDDKAEKESRENYRQLCYEALISYGCYARLWSNTGLPESKDALIAEAKSQIRSVNMMFGFYMDQPQNRIGATGWDTIRGHYMPGRT